MTVTHTISKTRAKVGETITLSTSEGQGFAYGIMWVTNYTSTDCQYSLSQLVEFGRSFTDYGDDGTLTNSVTIQFSHLNIKTLTPIYWSISTFNDFSIALADPIENNEFVTVGETIDVSFYINLAESVYSLGEKLATNISEKGVSASADDGLTTLANKIDDIYENIPRVIIEDDTVTDFADLRFTFVFPKNCSIIKGHSLAYLKNLKHCILPEGPYALGASAFSGCSNLVEITIPSTINLIGSSVFANTTSLNKIVFKSTTPPEVPYANAFSNLPTTCIIEVPRESLSAYKSASNYPDPNTYTYVGY